jgi:hypothetical protein
MRRVGIPAVAVSLVLLAGCSDSGDDGPASGSSTTSSRAPTSPMPDMEGPTSTTVFRAPTSCEEAPQLPACQPGHGDP